MSFYINRWSYSSKITTNLGFNLLFLTFRYLLHRSINFFFSSSPATHQNYSSHTIQITHDLTNERFMHFWTLEDRTKVGNRLGKLREGQVLSIQNITETTSTISVVSSRWPFQINLPLVYVRTLLGYLALNSFIFVKSY